MAKKKKKQDTMADVTMAGITSSVVVSAMPTPPGTALLKTGYATGISNVGRALPTMGAIKGTTMVMKSAGKLKKKSKKLFGKGV